MDFKATLWRIYEENQAKLPLEDRVASKAMCFTIGNSGLSCTKEQGHTGCHVAHGSLGTIINRWGE